MNRIYCYLPFGILNNNYRGFPCLLFENHNISVYRNYNQKQPRNPNRNLINNQFYAQRVINVINFFWTVFRDRKIVLRHNFFSFPIIFTLVKYDDNCEYWKRRDCHNFHQILAIMINICSNWWYHGITFNEQRSVQFLSSPINSVFINIFLSGAQILNWLSSY